jgi:hypothetical protein
VPSEHLPTVPSPCAERTRYFRGRGSATNSNAKIRDWAEENVQISLKTVYNNLDPEITTFADLPVRHEADATRVARRRATLAGYTLANELKRLFGE